MSTYGLTNEFSCEPLDLVIAAMTAVITASQPIQRRQNCTGCIHGLRQALASLCAELIGALAARISKRLGQYEERASNWKFRGCVARDKQAPSNGKLLRANREVYTWINDRAMPSPLSRCAGNLF